MLIFALAKGWIGRNVNYASNLDHGTEIGTGSIDGGTPKGASKAGAELASKPDVTPLNRAPGGEGDADTSTDLPLMVENLDRINPGAELDKTIALLVRKGDDAVGEMCTSFRSALRIMVSFTPRCWFSKVSTPKSLGGPGAAGAWDSWGIEFRFKGLGQPGSDGN